MILYFREKRSAISTKYRRILAILRGISVFLICLLLSAFLLNTKKRYFEKPVIVIVSDNSRSIVLQSDSAYFRTEFKDEIRNIIQMLEQKADVYTYEFDNDFRKEISFDFNGEQTDIYNAIDNVISRYEGRNIAGMVLITDGIVNTGNDPTVLRNRLYFPLHTIALGDTTTFSDAVIKSVRYNKSVGYGNRFPVEIVIHSTGLNGKTSKLVIKQDGREIASEAVRFTSGTFSETNTFIFDADKKGLIRLEIQLEPVDNEVNTANNFASAVIQVIDRKNKVAILFQSPHPDISAIKTSLEETRNYDIELFQVNAFNSSEIGQFDAVILFHLPDKKLKTNIVEQIAASKVPYLLIVGQNTDIRQLSQMNFGLKIQQTSQVNQEAFPFINTGFGLFQLSPDFQRKVRNFPPLITHFGNYSMNEGYQVVLYQKIGNVQTSNPMLAFSAEKEKMSAVLIGEGIFKWKLHDFLNNDNHLAFNEIIQKTTNLLVQQADKRRLRIHHKDIYYSTENAEISAELYNMSMELITSSNISFTIRNDEGTERELWFSPQISDYKLNLGKLRTGKYSWIASTKLDNELLEASGLFFVEQVLIEQLNTKADHNLLRFLASETGGKFFTQNEIPDVAEYIIKNSEFKQLEYLQEKTDELISVKWILIFLILFLSAEWAARKYLGSY